MKGTFMKELEVKDYLTECEELMADLLQSGLNRVPEGYGKKLSGLAKEGEQYGLLWFSGQMEAFARTLEEQRHTFQEQEPRQLMKQYFKLCRYIRLGIEKAGYDAARENLSNNVN